MHAPPPVGLGGARNAAHSADPRSRYDAPPRRAAAVRSTFRPGRSRPGGAAPPPAAPAVGPARALLDVREIHAEPRAAACDRGPRRRAADRPVLSPGVRLHDSSPGPRSCGGPTTAPDVSETVADAVVTGADLAAGAGTPGRWAAGSSGGGRCCPSGGQDEQEPMRTPRADRKGNAHDDLLIGSARSRLRSLRTLRGLVPSGPGGRPAPVRWSRRRGVRSRRALSRCWSRRCRRR